MRPRIKKQKEPILIYTTSKDKEMVELAKYNRKTYLKPKEVCYLSLIHISEPTRPY